MAAALVGDQEGTDRPAKAGEAAPVPFRVEMRS
jgi:hypothetical protein